MNLKTLIAFATLTAGTAFAVVESDLTLCRIQIDSGTKNTILSVPLVDVQTGNAVKVTDLVLTDNLANGTVLLHKTAAGSESWIVDNKEWQSLPVSEGTQTTQTGSASATGLNRGNAVIITRDSAEGSIYLYGRCADNVSRGTTIVSGGWTLLGNPNPEPFKLNTPNAWTGCTKGDKIVVLSDKGIGGKTYTFDEGVWKSDVYTVVNGLATKTQVDTNDSIPAGQGFWYVSKESSSPSINWCATETSVE